MYNGRMNPYYDAKELGWEQVTLDQGLSYEFDILAFWRTAAGLVFMAEDSGCSCPIPFEDYDGANATEIEQQLTRVPDLDAAAAAIKTWNKNYDNKTKVSDEEVRKTLDILRGWFK